MKSTWRDGDRSQWNRHHYLQEILHLHPTTAGKEVPVHQKTDKMPYLSQYQQHKWVLLHAIWPMLVHQVYVSYTGKNLPAIVAFLFYTLAFKGTC